MLMFSPSSLLFSLHHKSPIFFSRYWNYFIMRSWIRSDEKELKTLKFFIKCIFRLLSAVKISNLWNNWNFHSSFVDNLLSVEWMDNNTTTKVERKKEVENCSFVVSRRLKVEQERKRWEWNICKIFSCNITGKLANPTGIETRKFFAVENFKIEIVWKSFPVYQKFLSRFLCWINKLSISI